MQVESLLPLCAIVRPDGGVLHRQRPSMLSMVSWSSSSPWTAGAMCNTFAMAVIGGYHRIEDGAQSGLFE